MKSKTLTFTAANISTDAGEKLDASITVSQSYAEHPAYYDTSWPAGGTNIIYFYPKQLIVNNTTGINLEFVILSNDAEEAVYDSDPANYTGWIKLSNSTEYMFKRLGKINKIVVRRMTSPETTLIDLRVDLWGYFNA